MFGALKSDSTHHFFRNACTKSGSLRFHSFSVVDWFCLFIYLWVLTFPLLDCSDLGNFVITLIHLHPYPFLLLYCVLLSTNNNFISRYIFLYRKMFSVLNYLMFFFHVIIGFFDSISRIALGAGIGILAVERNDRNVLPRGYEHIDNDKITSVTNTGGVYYWNDHLH